MKIQKRTYCFALELLKMVDFLKENREFEIANQLLRSGTSIGANVQEAQAASSRKDFAQKINIALKESRETVFWLNLLIDSDKLENYPNAKSLLSECISITNILGKILKTTRSRN